MRTNLPAYCRLERSQVQKTASWQKRIVLLFLLLLFLLCACESNHTFTDPNPYLHESFFGEALYAEVHHSMTQEEKDVGEDVLRQMREVLEYTGLESDANSNVGALSQYYWFPYFDRPAKVDASAELVSCVKQDDGFHVWVLYSPALYDPDENLLTGSQDILTLLTVAPEGDGWIVAMLQEPL